MPSQRGIVDGLAQSFSDGLRSMNFGQSPEASPTEDLEGSLSARSASQRTAKLNFARLFKYTQLAYLSKPKGDRALFRRIGKLRPQRFLEIGIGSGERMQRMIELARLYAEGQPLHYFGIDLFEASDRPQAITYKRAHRLLTGLEIRGQLIPGDALSALSRWANSLANLDLILISTEHDDESLEDAWFYFPRMLQPSSVVLRERRIESDKGPQVRFETLSHAEIQRRAQHRKPRAAA